MIVLRFTGGLAWVVGEDNEFSEVSNSHSSDRVHYVHVGYTNYATWHSAFLRMYDCCCLEALGCLGIMPETQIAALQIGCLPVRSAGGSHGTLTDLEFFKSCLDLGKAWKVSLYTICLRDGAWQTFDTSSRLIPIELLDKSMVDAPEFVVWRGSVFEAQARSAAQRTRGQASNLEPRKQPRPKTQRMKRRADAQGEDVLVEDVHFHATPGEEPGEKQDADSALADFIQEMCQEASSASEDASNDAADGGHGPGSDLSASADEASSADDDFDWDGLLAQAADDGGADADEQAPAGAAAAELAPAAALPERRAGDIPVAHGLRRPDFSKDEFQVAPYGRLRYYPHRATSVRQSLTTLPAWKQGDGTQTISLPQMFLLCFVRNEGKRKLKKG